MTKPLPQWSLPVGFQETLDEDGEVELPGWDPITVTVMSGTLWMGREIETSWQAEITAGARGLDGYGIEKLVLDGLRQVDSDLVTRIHGDSGHATCVFMGRNRSRLSGSGRICLAPPRVIEPRSPDLKKISIVFARF